MKKLSKFWGFRSDNIIKKILASLYYIFCLIMIFAFTTDVPSIKSNMYDTIIFKICQVWRANLI